MVLAVVFAAAILGLVVGEALGGSAQAGPEPESQPDDRPLDEATIAWLADRALAVTDPLTAIGCGVSVQGSAVWVHGSPITNRHLVERAERVVIGSEAVSAASAATVEGSATEYGLLDLALLRAPGEGVSFGLGRRETARLAPRDPPPGESVLMAGWVGDRFRVLPGRVHTYTAGAAYGPGTVMLLEPATEPGFSGGPVLDRNGAVVGVLRAVDDRTSLAVALPTSEVQQWRGMEMEKVGAPSCP